VDRNKSLETHQSGSRPKRGGGHFPNSLSKAHSNGVFSEGSLNRKHPYSLRGLVYRRPHPQILAIPGNGLCLIWMEEVLPSAMVPQQFLILGPD
jgi:hypothetical protein